MQDELLNAAILLRRGSWVDPELFERAAKRMAELEADAKRYRWLRDSFATTSQPMIQARPPCQDKHTEICWGGYGDGLDAAIDAAIAESAK